MPSVADPNEQLIKAAKIGDLNGVQRQLSHGAAAHTEHDAPLRWAASGPYIAIVELLLQNGANPAASNHEALRFAAANGHAEIVKLLLRWGSAAHAHNDYAMRFAAINGHADVVAILIQHTNYSAELLAQARMCGESARAGGVLAVIDAFEQAQALSAQRQQQPPIQADLSVQPALPRPRPRSPRRSCQL